MNDDANVTNGTTNGAPAGAKDDKAQGHAHGHALAKVIHVLPHATVALDVVRKMRGDATVSVELRLAVDGAGGATTTLVGGVDAKMLRALAACLTRAAEKL